MFNDNRAYKISNKVIERKWDETTNGLVTKKLFFANIGQTKTYIKFN